MHDELVIGVFTLDQRLYDQLVKCFRDTADRTAQFNYRDRLDSLQSFACDSNLIVVFDMQHERDACLRWIQKLSETWPNAVCVCVEEQFSQEQSLEAVRAGARDFLVGEFTNDEAKSLVKRLSKAFGPSHVASTVAAVAGTAGGCGTSTVTANLAVEIARLQASPVGILGLNTFSSGAELVLSLRPTTTLFDLWERLGELDSTLVELAAERHPSGVSLVTAQRWPLDQLPIPGNLVRRVILLMEELFPYVLIDVPHEFTSAAQVAIGSAEMVLLVTQYSMGSAAGAACVMNGLEMLDYPQDAVHWVANSVSEPAPLTIRQLRHVLSSDPIARLPFDPKTVGRGARDGLPLFDADRKAPITRGFQDLAAEICVLAGRDRGVFHGDGSPARIGSSIARMTR